MIHAVNTMDKLQFLSFISDKNIYDVKSTAFQLLFWILRKCWNSTEIANKTANLNIKTKMQKSLKDDINHIEAMIFTVSDPSLLTA